MFNFVFGYLPSYMWPVSYFFTNIYTVHDFDSTHKILFEVHMCVCVCVCVCVRARARAAPKFA